MLSGMLFVLSQPDHSKLNQRKPKAWPINYAVPEPEQKLAASEEWAKELVRDQPREERAAGGVPRACWVRARI